MSIKSDIKVALCLALRQPVNISIETHTECNRRCVYCPLSYDKTRPKTEMSWETFTRIIQIVKSHPFYIGDMSICGYCEPTKDPRFTEMLKHIRTELPRRNRLMGRHITFSTNGDRATDADWREWSKYADIAVWTHHDRNDFHDYIKTKIGGMVRMEQPAITDMCNRVGTAVVAGVKYEKTFWCKRQLVIVISAFGDVCFCCDDYNATIGTGINVNTCDDFYTEWRKWGRAVKRTKVFFNGKVSECANCGRNKTDVNVPCL